MKTGTHETISIQPKPKPPVSSWWACAYPNRDAWYAVAQGEAERLHKSKPTLAASDFNAVKFGDYWKKPQQTERRYVDEAEQVA